MSIWSSIGKTVLALNGDDEAANYRGEGEPSLRVDVAIARPWHSCTRLAIFSSRSGTGGPNVTAVLGPEAVRQLIQNLTDAQATP